MTGMNYEETKAIRLSEAERRAYEAVKNARTALFKALQSSQTNRSTKRDEQALSEAYSSVNKAFTIISSQFIVR